MTDKTLFPLGPATGNLTARQQTVLDILHAHPDGARAIDVGAQLHVALGRSCGCTSTVTCRYAMGEAGELLRGLRRRDLAIQRRSGRWELMHPPVTGTDPSTTPFPDGF